MSEYLNVVKKLISEKLEIDPKEVTPDSYFEDDLNMAKLDLIEILTELEDMLHVDLIAQKDEIESVGDLLDIIAEQVD